MFKGIKKAIKRVTATGIIAITAISGATNALAQAPFWAQKSANTFSAQLNAEAEKNGWNEPANRFFMAKALGEQFDCEGIVTRFATDTDDKVVNELLYKGIVVGYGDGTFRGNEPMKRSYMVGLLDNLGLIDKSKVTDEMVAKMQKVFTDVKGDHWYNDGLTAALYTESDINKQRLIEGNKHEDETRTADMEETLTYAQTLEFVARLKELTPETLNLVELPRGEEEGKIGLVHGVTAEDDKDLKEVELKELEKVTEADEATQTTSELPQVNDPVELPQVVEELPAVDNSKVVQQEENLTPAELPQVVEELPKVQDTRVSELKGVSNGAPDTTLGELPQVSELEGVKEVASTELPTPETSSLPTVISGLAPSDEKEADCFELTLTSSASTSDDNNLSELPAVVSGVAPEGEEEADCFELTLAPELGVISLLE